MKPHSKVTIFMVVMIVMLSIYYFTLGDDKAQQTGNDQNNPGNKMEYRYPLYEQLREQSALDRSRLISELQTQMVSATETPKDKNDAFSVIMQIQKMSSDEYAFETMMRQEGYLDSFVMSTNATSEVPIVTIRVLDSEHSAKEANQIIVMAKTHFGTAYEVSVIFDTPEEE